MASMSQSQRSVTNKARAQQQSRRVWTIPEEHQLLVGLKDLIARGLKADNGFKSGYLTILEQHMQAHFPGTDLRADPHINSKITTWKKNYASLCGMLSRSGIGWNDTDRIIEVSEEQDWNDYVKIDSNARTMRHKPWPYYHDWCLIFGKDRATGEHAKDLGDAADKIKNDLKGKNHVELSDDYVPRTDHIFTDIDDDFLSACLGDTASSPIKKASKKVCGKKRGREVVEAEDKMVEMMSKFFDKHSGHFEKIVDKLGVDESATMRKKVFDALDNIGHYDLVQKLKVATVLCEKKDFEIFFTTSDVNRQQLVTMILKGDYKV